MAALKLLKMELLFLEIPKYLLPTLKMLRSQNSPVMPSALPTLSSLLRRESSLKMT
jgi:hypothetical protein